MGEKDYNNVQVWMLIFITVGTLYIYIHMGAIFVINIYHRLIG